MAKIFTDINRSNVVNVLSSIKVYPLTYFPHYLHPNNTLFLNGNEDNHGDDDMDFEDEKFLPTLGVRSTYPIRLKLPTDINATVQQNIVLKLVQQKNDYINDVEKLVGNYKRSKTANTSTKSKAKSKVYSMHLNSLMELTAKDPDPYFFGSYNWYYTGGVLETASIVDVDFLFYVSGENLNVFNSAAISASKNHHLKLEHLDSTNQIICDTIYEIIKSHDNCFVAARQKHHFAVFCLQDNLTQQDFQCERNIPFMSGAFNQHQFFTIDANRVIQRHDLRANRENGRMHLKLPKNHNHWCQLKSYNSQLIYADSNEIKLYDTRLFGKKLSQSMRMSIDSVTEKCEEITSICSDANENNFYVATTHNLFAFDIRYGMESCNQLTRYTHQMKTPPLMLDASGGGATGYAPNERLITMAGTFSDDISIVQHTKAVNEKIRSHNIPQTPLGLTDISHQLRENGLHAKADNLTQNKNRFVNIGTRFVRIDSNLFLLSEKSSGEIFYQEITSETERLQQRAEFDNKLYRNVDFGVENQRDVDVDVDDDDDGSDADADDSIDAASAAVSAAAPKVTTVTNFDSLKRILKFKLNTPEMGGEEVPDIENPQPKKWQQSIEQLQSYKDMLSADLLSIWLDQQMPPAKEDKSDKTEFVHGWVNRSTAENVYDDDQYSDF